MKKSLAIFLFALAMGVCAGEKHILGYGWEFLSASTEDVYRNRAKLADAGFSGFLLAMDRTNDKGKLVRARDLMADPYWKDSDFDRSVGYLKTCLGEPGFRHSLAFAFLIPAKRLKWDDDAAWAKATSNMGVLARAAKRAGFNGICLDQEDYTKQRQFKLEKGDPEYVKTCALARMRGRQLFGALFENFPDARLMAFWLYTQWRTEVIAPDPAAAAAAAGDLWPAFLDGMLDVVPPTVKFIDGNESTGYRTRGGINAWYGSAYESLRLARELVAPENRDIYASRLSVGFGLYIDSYIAKENSDWYLPPLGGSRMRAFAANLMDASSVADDYIWIYGEKGTIVDWDVKHSPHLQSPTWESKLPGFRKLMRLASSRIAAAQKIVAEEKLQNRFANPGCDGAEGALPNGYTTWTRLKEPPKGLFGVDAKVGCAKPGSLRLTDSGSYTASIGGLKPGSIVFVRARIKGTEFPSVVVGWKRGGNWDWKLPTQYLNKRQSDGKEEWKTVEGLCVVPENSDGLGFVLGGTGSVEKPVYIDDVEGYVVFE